MLLLRHSVSASSDSVVLTVPILSSKSKSCRLKIGEKRGEDYSYVMLSNVKPYVSPHVSVLIIDIQAVEEHTRLKKNGLLVS